MSQASSASESATNITAPGGSINHSQGWIVLAVIAAAVVLAVWLWRRK